MNKILKKTIAFSLKNKYFIIFSTVLLIIYGFITFRNMSIEAFPDVTNTEITIITQWPGRRHLPSLPRDAGRAQVEPLPPRLLQPRGCPRLAAGPLAWAIRSPGRLNRWPPSVMIKSEKGGAP